MYNLRRASHIII